MEEELNLKKLNQKLNQNFRKRWWIILPLFLFIIGFGLYVIFSGLTCHIWNDQSNYYTANYFYIDGFKPVCMSLSDYDYIYNNHDIFICLKEKGDFQDPFNCKRKFKGEIKWLDEN